jgi:hypothetical protein
VYPALAFNSLRTVFGETPFQALGSVYEPAVYGAAVLAAYWLFLYLLYRTRLFVRVEGPRSGQGITGRMFGCAWVLIACRPGSHAARAGRKSAA